MSIFHVRFCSVRRVLLERLVTWMLECHPTLEEALEEVDGTASAMRQVVQFHLGKRVPKPREPLEVEVLRVERDMWRRAALARDPLGMIEDAFQAGQRVTVLREREAREPAAA